MEEQAAATMLDTRERLFSCAGIALLKGVVSRYQNEELWQGLLQAQTALRDYFARLGLQLLVNEADEYAYLRQKEDTGLPRLVNRTQLSYGLSLLLVELRRALGELTALEQGQCLVSLTDAVRWLKPFFPPVENEQRFQQQVERYLHQAEEMGFVRAQGAQYEVRPLLRSFVDDQWLSDFQQRLTEYQTYGKARAAAAEGTLLRTDEEDRDEPV